MFSDDHNDLPAGELIGTKSRVDEIDEALVELVSRLRGDSSMWEAVVVEMSDQALIGVRNIINRCAETSLRRSEEDIMAYYNNSVIVAFIGEYNKAFHKAPAVAAALTDLARSMGM